jgi:MacB-like protein
MNYNVSPGYLGAAGTMLLAGRNLTLHDDSNAPKVALVNRQFALKVFGSVDKAIGGHFKFWGGTRAEVVGVVEDGKYRTLTEDQQPAMFFSFLQQQLSGTWLLVRSGRDPEHFQGAGALAARAGRGVAFRREAVEPGNGLSVSRGTPPGYVG